MLLLGKVIEWFSDESDDGFTFKADYGVIIDSFNSQYGHCFVVVIIVDDKYLEIREVESSIISNIILEKLEVDKAYGNNLYLIRSLLRY
jgi:hypothetical protein